MCEGEGVISMNLFENHKSLTEIWRQILILFRFRLKFWRTVARHNEKKQRRLSELIIWNKSKCSNRKHVRGKIESGSCPQEDVGCHQRSHQWRWVRIWFCKLSQRSSRFSWCRLVILIFRRDKIFTMRDQSLILEEILLRCSIFIQYFVSFQSGLHLYHSD